MRRGLLGGTFDPIHLGHLLVAEEVRDRFGLEEVGFIPTGVPWMKKQRLLSSGKHRKEMVRLAVESKPGFSVLDLELKRAGDTYTVDTLDELRSQGADGDELFFIMGMDSLRTLHRWKEPGRVMEMATLVAVSRPGYEEVDLGPLESLVPEAASRITLMTGPLVDVSGVDIRRRVAEGRSSRYLVPDPVREYIEAHGLYRQVEEVEAGVGPSASAEGQGLAEDILEEAQKGGALRYGEFVLSSGLTSSYYFDGRLLSLSPRGASLVARAMLPLVRGSGAEAIGGPTLGADPIVAAVALASHQDSGRPVPGFIVRSGSKDHGMGRMVEGPLPSGAPVAIVDDVCSTGGSLFHAIRAAEAEGCIVVLVAAILDRCQGGSERLRQEGYSFRAILEADAQGNITPAGAGKRLPKRSPRDTA